MSLCGLDADSVKQAYETTIADAAGWFLLKYAGRADVELLTQGTGGFVETREAIAKYEEPSPLFGVIIYRRKKVLVKYVPEETSRLLQARLSVHFQSVIEAFPHDALIEIKSSQELTETALSSSATSLKSSSSVRSAAGRPHKPLSEILEDGSESVTHKSSTTEPVEMKRASHTEERSGRETEGVNGDKEFASDGSEAAATRPPLSSSLKKLDLPASTERPSTAVPTKRVHTEGRFDPRSSLDSARPSTQPLTSSVKETYVPYSYKPKAKLGPRPAAEPDLASRSSATYTRPVSTLPSGVVMPAKKNLAFERPQTQQSSSKPPFPENGIVVGMSSVGHAPGRPGSSHGSIVTVPNSVYYPEPQSPTTPEVSLEKQRLMKALQQRKKQKMARKASADQEEKNVENKEHDVGKKEESSDATPDPTTQNVPETLSEPGEPAIKAETQSRQANTSDPTGLSIGSDPMASYDGSTKPQDGAQSNSESIEEPQAKAEPVKGAQLAEIAPIEDLKRKTSGADAAQSLAPIYMEPHKNGVLGQQLNHELEIDQERPLNITAGNTVADQSSTIEAKGSKECLLGTQQQTKGADAAATDIAETGAIEPAQSQVPVDESPASFDSAPTPILTAPQEEVTSRTPAHATEGPAHVSSAPDTQVEVTTEENLSSTVEDEQLSPAHTAEGKDSGKETTEDTASDQDEDSPTAATITVRDLQEEESHAAPVSASNTKAHTTDNKKRPPPIEPPNFDSFDAASMSGDSLMEELQSATVEQATPMIISQSPATPVFPILSRRSSAASSKLIRSVTPQLDGKTPPLPAMSPELKKSISESSPTKRDQDKRSVSNPLDALPSMPKDNGLQINHLTRFNSRASSGSPSPEKVSVERQGSKKSGGVSSLISSRIKALEKLSGSNSPANATIATPSLISVSKRKTSLTTPPSSAGTGASRKTHETKQFPSPSSSPHNFVMRTFGSRKAPALKIDSNKRPEAVSVTTAVATPPTVVESTLDTNSKEASRPTLDRSEYSYSSVTESTASTPPVTQTDQPKSPSYFSKSNKKKAKSKKGSVSSISSAVLESLTSPSRNSFSSRRSTASRRSSGETVRPPQTTPFSPGSEAKSSKGSKEEREKKESKKSRLLKRMSSMAMSPRKNNPVMSPPLTEQPIEESQEPESSVKWMPMVLGDVNAQFPDTLLWKRRHLEIDSHGYLILSPSKMDKSSRITTKRYHVTEFRTPYMPDQDREELPYSVILDFYDSSTLQCACEHSHAQLEVLQVLARAHATFTSAERR